MIRKTLAFTLAETLIVMGIIGVVSALTLPNLNAATGEKEKVARVKKIYSDLTDAFGRAQAVYGPFNEWFQNDTTSAAQATRFGERMTEFMKVSKNCGTDVNKGCFSPKALLDWDGSTFSGQSNDSDSSMYKIITADGMSIAFLGGYSIFVDTDGPNKGPNTIGIDRFSFYIYNNNLEPLSAQGNPSFSRNGAFDDSYDIYIWAIENDNMDYLKCAEKLNWQTKTSCK